LIDLSAKGPGRIIPAYICWVCGSGPSYGRRLIQNAIDEEFSQNRIEKHSYSSPSPFFYDRIFLPKKEFLKETYSARISMDLKLGSLSPKF
jgi:hypothetical protein